MEAHCISWPLRGALLLAVVVLGFGWWLQPRAASLQQALTEILDGDADRAERERCLGVVRDLGLQAAAQGDVRAGLLAAMAALDLEDRASFDSAVTLLAGKTAYLPGGGPTDPDALSEAALGEPYLETLMLAFEAENRGAAREATGRFRRARGTARSFGARLVALVATEGLERLR